MWEISPSKHYLVPFELVVLDRERCTSCGVVFSCSVALSSCSVISCLMPFIRFSMSSSYQIPVYLLKLDSGQTRLPVMEIITRDIANLACWSFKKIQCLHITALTIIRGSTAWQTTKITLKTVLYIFFCAIHPNICPIISICTCNMGISISFKINHCIVQVWSGRNTWISISTSTAKSKLRISIWTLSWGDSSITATRSIKAWDKSCFGQH